jgi:hypothetical protein
MFYKNTYLHIWKYTHTYKLVNIQPVKIVKEVTRTVTPPENPVPTPSIYLPFLTHLHSAIFAYL